MILQLINYSTMLSTMIRVMSGLQRRDGIKSKVKVKSNIYELQGKLKMILEELQSVLLARQLL